MSTGNASRSGKSGSKRALEKTLESALETKVAEKVARKVADKVTKEVAKEEAKNEKLAEKAARHERQSQKLARKAALREQQLDRLSQHLGVIDVWTRVEPGGRRPRFTREQIASVAVRIADAEGFDAVSMRRIALELDAGTMTLYHYVRTKDELLTLVCDTVMGEVLLDDAELRKGDWRTTLTRIACKTRDTLLRHPWILDITDDPPIGPNGIRHFDQTLQAVNGLGVSLARRLDIVSAVDEYVFGYCLNQRNNVQDGHGAGIDDAMADYVQGLIATGDYPELAAISKAHGVAGGWAVVDKHLRDPGRFGRNLDALLDGLAP